MTSAPVVNGMELMATPRTDNMQTHKTNEQFAGSLRKAVEKGGQRPDHREQQERTAKTGKQEDAKTAEERMKSSGETKPVSMDRDAKTTVSEQDMTDKVSKRDVEDAVSKVTKALQESLDISREELENAMELLGLSAANLLQPANITALLVEVTGIRDSLELVTDASLYETWQSLQDTAGELLQEMAWKLEVAPEEAAGLLPDIWEMMQQTADETSQPGLNENGVETVLQSMTDSVTDESAKQFITEENSTDELSAEDVLGEIPEEYSTTTVVAEDATGQFEDQSQGKTGGRSKEHGNEGNQGNASLNSGVSGNEFGSFVTRVESNWRPFETEQTGGLDFLQEMSRANETEEIARQILDHMKVQVKEGVSELEMQLHPASLGNVHVLLVAKEGNITAQFTAQTEAVKAALESQMVQLREQFEEQGIKVDAVEVAVSNHQFEKQYQGDEQREFQRNDRNKVRTRRINLEELGDEELDLLLTDEEKLQADMMKKNGSTIDFTA